MNDNERNPLVNDTNNRQNNTNLPSYPIYQVEQEQIYDQAHNQREIPFRLSQETVVVLSTVAAFLLFISVLWACLTLIKN